MPASKQHTGSTHFGPHAPRTSSSGESFESLVSGLFPFKSNRARPEGSAGSKHGRRSNDMFDDLPNGLQEGDLHDEQYDALLGNQQDEPQPDVQKSSLITHDQNLGESDGLLSAQQEVAKQESVQQESAQQESAQQDIKQQFSTGSCQNPRTVAQVDQMEAWAGKV